MALVNNKNLKNLENELDLWELVLIVFRGKWIVISVTAFASILGVIYSLSLPNIYKSQALLVPVNPSTGISSAVRSYGGLAGFAGINIPPDGDEGNSAKALKKINSLSFFENNILPNIFLPDLMAIESWDSKSNTIAYDQDLYNKDKNLWTREYAYPQQQIPSAQESFEIYMKHLRLTEDEITGFITISIKHQSPLIAKQWTELVVNEVNSFYRQKDRAESEKAADYLNIQMSVTDLSEIKQVLAQLMQEEIKKLSLIEANEFYVFDYIDPPAVMEKKSAPRRSIICIISAIIGAIFGTILVFMKHFLLRKRAI